jgi:hypothetical protein
MTNHIATNAASINAAAIVELTKTLVVGRRVHCILYGGKNGIITNVHGVAGVVPTRVLGGVMHSGGSAEIDVVWDDGSQSRRVPECIIEGVQWRIYDQVVGADVVAERIAAATIYQAQQKAKEDAEKAAKAAAQAAALEAGRKIGLIPESEFFKSGKRGTAAAYNLRVELKAAGIKAAVNQDGYSAINITAASGDLAAVKAIASKYKSGSFNSMSDCYEYDASAWGRVFGDVQYIFTCCAE